MRKDKDEVFTLRKQGKTYREIQKMVHISRDTLSQWFKNEEWSKHIKKSNTDRHIKISTEHLYKIHEGRRRTLEAYYQKAEKEAEEDFKIHKNNPLFMAGLMLYAGEGDQRDKSTIRLANVDFFLHRIFIKFSEEFLKISREKMKLSVLLYPDLDVFTCTQRWLTELNIPQENLYKPQIIQGKLKTRKLHFGVGTTIILGSFLKRKLMFWIKAAKQELC